MDQLLVRAMEKSILISAVKAGDTESVEDLLDKGVPIDTKGDMGMSLLHLAAEGGHVTTMRLLIRRGCGVDSVDSVREFTPLHWSAAMGQTKAVRELIRKGASKSVVAGNYEIPQAALKGDKKTAEAMLEQGHPLHVVLSAYQGSPLYFGTALDQAALNGHVETALAMLEEGCPLNVVNSARATVLHFAAEGGNVDLVRELVSRGCDVNAVTIFGWTPLHNAANYGRTEAVRELIKLGAAMSVVGGNGGTPLHQAAIKGHVETAVAMLEEGCPLDVVNGAEATVLDFAAESGNVELVRELVGRGCDVNAVKANGCTPLHSAAGRGRTEAVNELMKLGAAKSVVGGNCGTPLHQAAIKGHVETAVAMLEKGCPLDVVNGAGATVLDFASQGGNVDLVRELVVRGCDVNAVKADGCTALHSAAGCGKTETVHELIKLGAVKTVVAGNCGTPLHQAAINGHVETAVAMLEEGCPLDIVSIAGATVLHFASQGGNVNLVRELVVRGCDVNALKADGCTPLHSAAGRGRTEAVHELIKVGAAKSVVGGNCGTPLHQAAIGGHVETAVAMLEEGCPLDVVSSAGDTVLHFAAAGGNVELVRELVGGRGCDVNAVKANGCTPLHDAAGHGRTEAVRELIELGAAKSVIAGAYGTPLHQAIVHGNVETVEALLEDELSESDMVSHDVTPLMVQVLDSGIIGTCNSLGQTPVMWALRCGQVEVFKLLISKGGSIRSDRDQHSLCAFEHCFISGQACKLRQLCEASGIRSGVEGLRGVLTTLITQGLAEAHKVLCLSAVSGDSIFLDDTYIELVASDACAMPEAVNCVRYCFQSGEGGSFIDQLKIPGEISLNPLHMALLSMKCYEMGFAIRSVEHGIKDHTSFITKLLSHPVLKETVHEHFPNGLSPLDLARQFELHHIAALIEGVGGCPGVWADIPRDVFVSCCSELFTMYPLLKKVCDTSQGGHEAVKKAVMKFLGAHTVTSVIQVADDSWLVKEQVLGQRPDLGDVVTHVLPHIQVRSKWKSIGLTLGIKKTTLDQFSNDDDPYLETLSYWLEHGSSVTWKTLLDVLGLFETKHTVDELMDKIVSVLGGGDQAPFQLPTPPGSTGDIEETSSKRTAQLSWPPAKRRRTSDAEGEPSLRKRSPEDALQDQPSAKREVRCALTGSEGTVEVLGVSSSASIVGGGAVVAERSPPVCEAKQVLSDFRAQLIADVDANTVVWELLYKNIISRGVQERISRTDEPKQQNEILHDCLQRTCTKEALMEVCDIIVSVRGHPKMRELGEAMKRRLHTATPV